MTSNSNGKDLTLKDIAVEQEGIFFHAYFIWKAGPHEVSRFTVKSKSGDMYKFYQSTGYTRKEAIDGLIDGFKESLEKVRHAS